MTFGGSITAGYANYFKFSGEAGRAEYWWFWLWYCILTVVFFLFLISGVMLEHEQAPGARAVMIVAGLVALPVIGSFIPLLSVQVRRLHDTGHSGWWVLGSVLLSAVHGGLHAATRHDPSPGLHGVSMVLSLLWLGINIAIFVFLVQPSRTGYGRYSRY